MVRTDHHACECACPLQDASVFCMALPCKECQWGGPWPCAYTYSFDSVVSSRLLCNHAAYFPKSVLLCRFVNTVLTWLINPIVLGSIIVFIGFWLIIVRGKLKRYFRESNKLKEEFDKYRREMQLKVSVTAPKV